MSDRTGCPGNANQLLNLTRISMDVGHLHIKSICVVWTLGGLMTVHLKISSVGSSGSVGYMAAIGGFLILEQTEHKLGWHCNSKSDLFPRRTRLWQGYPLSSFLLITLMHRIPPKTRAKNSHSMMTL